MSNLIFKVTPNKVFRSAGLKSFVRRMCTQSPAAAAEKVCTECNQTIKVCSNCHQSINVAPAVGWWNGFNEYQKIIITCSTTMGLVGVDCCVMEEKAAGWPKLKKRLSGKPYLESWVLPWLTTEST